MKLVSAEVQDTLTFSPTDEIDAYCTAGCETGFGKLVRDFNAGMVNCTGQGLSDIQYWDQAAAVIAAGDDAYCETWTTANVMVNLVNGPYFSALFTDDDLGAQVMICQEADRDAFLQAYYAPFANAEDLPLACSDTHISIVGAGLEAGSEPSCVDSDDWHKKDAPSKDCDWVAQYTTRCAVKGADKTLASVSCPATCGTC